MSFTESYVCRSSSRSSSNHPNCILSAMGPADFFADVVSRVDGFMDRDSCWLFSGSAYIGEFKAVLMLHARFATEGLADIAGLIYEGTLEMNGVSAAKLHLSDDLLLVLYMRRQFSEVDISRSVHGADVLPFKPYGAFVQTEAELWIARSHEADSPAVPYESWL